MQPLPSTLTASEARANLYDLLDEVRTYLKRFTITHRGKPDVVVMPAEDVVAMEETIEILSDKGLMRQIQQAKRDFAAGRYSTLEEAEQKLGLAPIKPKQKAS